MSTPDYYDILNVQPSALRSDIYKSYKSLMLKNHPDKNPESQKATFTRKTQLLVEAWGVLQDESKRREYDKTRPRNAGPQASRPAQPTSTGPSKSRQEEPREPRRPKEQSKQKAPNSEERADHGNAGPRAQSTPPRPTGPKTQTDAESRAKKQAWQEYADRQKNNMLNCEKAIRDWETELSRLDKLLKYNIEELKKYREFRISENDLTRDRLTRYSTACMAVIKVMKEELQTEQILLKHLEGQLQERWEAEKARQQEENERTEHEHFKKRGDARQEARDRARDERAKQDKARAEEEEARNRYDQGQGNEKAEREKERAQQERQRAQQEREQKKRNNAHQQEQKANQQQNHKTSQAKADAEAEARRQTYDRLQEFLARQREAEARRATAQATADTARFARETERIRVEREAAAARRHAAMAAESDARAQQRRRGGYTLVFLVMCAALWISPRSSAAFMGMGVVWWYVIGS
ncbi:hypothetical protein NX059_003532 [Plenodomus lindquistii]|nr:hypothetical protein NX059_003532 [Plenodomus lindquistii]